MTLLDMSVREFLDQLASSAPVPGGGSVAATTGAMAAGLITMVCALTLGKKKYAAVEGEMRSIHDRAEMLRDELQTLAAADAEAFRRLSAAYKLPRETSADIAIRRDAIQAALRLATEVPLKIAHAAAAVLPLCQPAAQKGNSMAVSDVGVAALLAQAAVHSALYNVQINLHNLEDQLFLRQARAQATDLTANLQEQTEHALQAVQDVLNT